jgi:NADH-quinone oxidoreductase subunit N
MLFYLFFYTLATFGAFAVVVTLTREGETGVMIDELSGLWSERPWLAAAMAVIMLAMLGFPIFGGAGFFAKWYVLQAALQAPVQQTTLAVVLALTTALSAGYYLHVVMVMFMRPRPEDAPRIERSGGLTQMVLAVTVALILIIGFLPDYVVRVTRNGRPRMEIEGSITQLPPRATTAPPDSARHVADTRPAERIR